MLLCHLLVSSESSVLGLRHPHRIQKGAVGVSMNSFHGCKGGQHHADFWGLEYRQELINVACGNIHIPLSEEAEDLGQQVLLFLRELRIPIHDIIVKRDFLRQPVHLVLSLVGLKGPRILERFIISTGYKQGHINLRRINSPHSHSERTGQSLLRLSRHVEWLRSVNSIGTSGPSSMHGSVHGEAG